MAVNVIMPQMGESIFEGTVTKWLKKPGEKVERDEPLFEISTDKVDAEIPSPAAGVLREIKVNEGQTVRIQTVVGVIDVQGAVAAPPAPASGAKPNAAPAGTEPQPEGTPTPESSAGSPQPLKDAEAAATQQSALVAPSPAKATPAAAKP